MGQNLLWYKIRLINTRRLLDKLGLHLNERSSLVSRIVSRNYIELQTPILGVTHMGPFWKRLRVCRTRWNEYIQNEGIREGVKGFFLNHQMTWSPTLCDQNEEATAYNRKIVHDELVEVAKHLKIKKFPGPDAKTNVALKATIVIFFLSVVTSQLGQNLLLRLVDQHYSRMYGNRKNFQRDDLRPVKFESTTLSLVLLNNYTFTSTAIWAPQ